MHRVVDINTPVDANSVSALYLCAYKDTVDAERIPDTIYAINNKLLEAANKIGIIINFEITAFQRQMFLLNLIKSFRLINFL